MFVKYAILSLWETCKGDCYLVFHIDDSGPSRGQTIDFLFFFQFWHQVPVFVKFLSSLSFVETSSQFRTSWGCSDIFWIDLFDQSQCEACQQFVTCSADQSRLCQSDKAGHLKASQIKMFTMFYYSQQNDLFNFKSNYFLLM